MSDKKHKPRGARVGKFCAYASRGGTCECKNEVVNGKGKNNYKINGEIPGDWIKTPKPGMNSTANGKNSGVEFLSTSGKRAFKYFEAHHILSVAPVSSILLGSNANDIRQALTTVEWCINKKANMIAMPSMAHTVHWYVVLKKTVKPPFGNIPHHDWQHGEYIEEIEKKLGVLIADIREHIVKHTDPTDSIKKDIEKLVEEFRDCLGVRGMRSGGTHAAYSNKGASDACYPFSMASDQFVKHKVLPSVKLSNEVNNWYKRILTLGGSP